MTNLAATECSSFEMRFFSLFVAGRSLSFPCDAQGHVDLDRLPGAARNNYLFARTLIGRDYSLPLVCECVREVPANV